MALKCKIWNSCTNPFRTIWRCRKWFKMPKMKWYFYKYYKWKNDDTPFIYFESWDIMWKDKYDTPRHEYDPYIRFIFFRWLCIDIKLMYDDVYCNDNTWEQMLWTYYYCDNDIRKAYRTWPWYSNDTKTTTWDKSMMTKKAIKELQNIEWDTSLMQDN